MATAEAASKTTASAAAMGTATTASTTACGGYFWRQNAH
jgi:hypothetical protein